MTAITTTPADHYPTASRLGRIVAVTRLHFVNTWTVLTLPWLIIAVIFLANMAIWALIIQSQPTAAAQAEAQENATLNGGSLFIFVYMLVVAVQAINLTFPFALGYGVTRRNFYLGTSLAFIALSAIYTIGLSALAWVELVTEGWGFGGRFFGMMYVGVESWPERIFVIFVGFLFFIFIGASTASVYVRWKASGMWAFFGILTLLLIGAAAIATFTQSWGAVGNWFVTNGVVGVAAWSLVVTAVAAIAGYGILRGATARQ